MVSLACINSVVWEGLRRARSYVLAFLFFTCHVSDTLLPYAAQSCMLVVEGVYLYNCRSLR